MVGIGVLGAGYWGPKHIRNFLGLADARVAMVADLVPERRASVEAQFPGVRTTDDYREVLASPEVDGVVIATPVSTHAPLAAEALAAGKHVLVEKPFARTVAECQNLIRMANDRVLMVGHTFLYNPAVRVLRDVVQGGEIGEVYHVHAQWLNLGLFQRDVNVIWDLAPHELAILMYVLGQSPTTISARGVDHVRPGLEDIAFVDLAFPSGTAASLHVSWLDPNKVRRMTFVGSRKMVVYDDVEPVEKVRLFDKGVELGLTGPAGEARVSYRVGEVVALPVPAEEPLRLECQHFVDCIAAGLRPLSDALQGLRVVEMLEATQTSLRFSGTAVPLGGAGLNGALRAPAAVFRPMTRAA
jgi:predicted dehydrogenase